MPNLLLGWPNAFTYGVLTASPQEAALPCTNLANDQGNAASALQLSATAGTFSVAVPTPTLFRLFSLHRTNLTAAATIRVQVFATLSSSSPMWDSGVVPAGVVPGYGQSVVVAPADVVGGYVLFTLSDPTNPDGHLNIPLAFAGPAWQPSRNMDSSSAFGRASQAANTTTRSGGVVTRSDWIKRLYVLSLSAVRVDEVWPRLMDLDLYARRGSNVLFVPNPASSLLNQQAVFGQLEPDGNIGYQAAKPLYRTYKATITERL